jgi:hypothetical protein
MVPTGAEQHHVALLGVAEALSLQRLFVVVQRDGVADLQLVDALERGRIDQNAAREERADVLGAVFLEPPGD